MPKFLVFQPVELTDALKAKGWAEKADNAQVNRFMLFLLLIIPVVAVALITGPQNGSIGRAFYGTHPLYGCRRAA